MRKIFPGCASTDEQSAKSKVLSVRPKNLFLMSFFPCFLPLPASLLPALCYLIILSAWYSTDCGIVTPSSLAVFKFIKSSNLVGCSTGSSAGFAPLRILSTYVAERRYNSALDGPYEIRPPACTQYRASYLSGRPGETIYNPYSHWIATNWKNDGNRLRRLLCNEDRGGRTRKNNVNLETNQISHERRILVFAIFCPSVFQDDVPAFT